MKRAGEALSNHFGPCCQPGIRPVMDRSGLATRFFLLLYIALLLGMCQSRISGDYPYLAPCAVLGPGNAAGDGGLSLMGNHRNIALDKIHQIEL